MILGIPVISTDVEGAKSVVGHHGRLIESSSEGLTKELVKALNKDVPKPSFDSEAYERASMELINNILEMYPGEAYPKNQFFFEICS